jgi:hypothetical protein
MRRPSLDTQSEVNMAEGDMKKGFVKDKPSESRSRGGKPIATRRKMICNSADSLAGIEDNYSHLDDVDGFSVFTDEGEAVMTLPLPTYHTGGAALQRQQQQPVNPGGSPSTEEQAQMLVELIAKEMAAALLRETSASTLASTNSRRSGDNSTADSSEHSSRSGAAGAIAEMVIKSVRQGQVKSGGDLDRTLQLLLKRGVGQGELHTSRDSLGQTFGPRDVEVSFSNSETEALSQSVASTIVSECPRSNGRLLEDEPHEEEGTGEILWTPAIAIKKQSEQLPVVPSKSKTSRQTPITSSFEPRTWTPADFTKKRASTGATPTKVDPEENEKRGGDDNDDEGDLDLDAEDDVSVLSDITGLTGAFTEAGSKRSAKEAEGKKEKVVFSLKDSDSFKEFTGDHRPFLGSTMYDRVSVKNLTIRKKAKELNSSPLSSARSSISVSFSHVHVRHYERIMNDNPASAAGPSIGIGWRFVEADPVCVDAFEKRPRTKAESLEDLQLNKTTRLALVRALGYTDKEIAASVRDLNKCRSNRKQTVDNLGVEKVEEAFEKVRRKVKRIFSLQRQSSQTSLDSSQTPSVDRISV